MFAFTRSGGGIRTVLRDGKKWGDTGVSVDMFICCLDHRGNWHEGMSGAWQLQPFGVDLIAQNCLQSVSEAILYPTCVWGLTFHTTALFFFFKPD